MGTKPWSISGDDSELFHAWEKDFYRNQAERRKAALCGSQNTLGIRIERARESAKRFLFQPL